MPTLQVVSSRNVFRDKFLSLYLEHHLPLDTIDSAAPWLKQHTWLFHVVNLPTLTPALEHAILAVCIAQLGRGNGHQALVHESLSFYTRSLQELRRAVLDPATRTNEQNICACLAMLMYEVLECPGMAMDGYFTHYSGAMKLLQLRGAHAYSSGLAHSMLRTLRVHSIYEGFRLRSKTFLVDPQWRNLPWSSCPTSKNPYDEILDLVLETPEVYARTDALDAVTKEQDILTGAVETVRECLRVDRELAGWLARFEAAVAGPLYCPELSRIHSSADSAEFGKVFPVRFSFPAPILAQAMVFYWLALVVVHSHTCEMYDQLTDLVARLDPIRGDVRCTCGGSNTNEEGRDKGLSSHPESDTGLTAPRFTCLRHFSTDLLPPLGSKTEWSRTSARNICQSAEYFLQDQLRGVGPILMLPALVTIKAFYRYVPNFGREIMWIDEVLAEIRGRGNAITEYIIV